MPRGVVPVIPTPFTEDEEFDPPALRHLVDFAASAGAGDLPSCYGGEFYKFTRAERCSVVKTSVEQCHGRVLVIAQSNHVCTRSAEEIARRNEALGADLIALALPRQFASSEEELLRFSEKVSKAVSVPVLIQDFNPGGPSVGPSFAKRLHEVAENFRYLKLEEPVVGAKIRAIRETTQGRVGIFEGGVGCTYLTCFPTEFQEPYLVWPFATCSCGYLNLPTRGRAKQQ